MIDEDILQVYAVHNDDVTAQKSKAEDEQKKLS
jgi:hypothetical protein